MAFVEHFEIPSTDIVRAQGFYKDVLGYEYEPWADDMGMLLQPDKQGINGDLHVEGVLNHPTVVFTVESIEETVAKAVEKGGSQLGEIQPMGEKARWVYITDSEGNVIGLYDERG